MAVCGLVLYLEQLDEISLHEKVLVHFALGKIVTWNGHLIVGTSFWVVVDDPDGYQVVLARHVVFNFVYYEADHVAAPVVLQCQPVVEPYFSSQNSSKLPPERFFYRLKLVCLNLAFNELFERFAVVLVLYIFFPYSFVLIQFPLHFCSLLLQFFLPRGLFFVPLDEFVLPPQSQQLCLGHLLVSPLFLQLQGLHFSLQGSDVYRFRLKFGDLLLGQSKLLILDLLLKFLILVDFTLDGVHAVHHFGRLKFLLVTQFAQREYLFLEQIVLRRVRSNLGLVPFNLYQVIGEGYLQTLPLSLKICDVQLHCCEL